jgi:hypothetical protein
MMVDNIASPFARRASLENSRWLGGHLFIA